jgi:hypothetical protein
MRAVSNLAHHCYAELAPAVPGVARLQHVTRLNSLTSFAKLAMSDHAKFRAIMDIGAKRTLIKAQTPTITVATSVAAPLFEPFELKAEVSRDIATHPQKLAHSSQIHR